MGKDETATQVAIRQSIIERGRRVVEGFQEHHVELVWHEVHDALIKEFGGMYRPQVVVSGAHAAVFLLDPAGNYSVRILP